MDARSSTVRVSRSDMNAASRSLSKPENGGFSWEEKRNPLCIVYGLYELIYIIHYVFFFRCCATFGTIKYPEKKIRRQVSERRVRETHFYRGVCLLSKHPFSPLLRRARSEDVYPSFCSHEFPRIPPGRSSEASPDHERTQRLPVGEPGSFLIFQTL